MTQYTQEWIETLLKEAWSYENREGWGKEELETKYVGTVKRKEYLYDLYVDTEGGYWYKTRMITDHGVISAHEATFGYPYNEWKRRKKRRKR